MNRNRKKAAAATLAAGMAVVLGAGTVMAAASTGDNGLQKEETVCRRRSNGCHSI